MILVMDPGIQAISARITQLQQRFDPSAAAASSTSTSAGTGSVSSATFASMLSSALGVTALDESGSGELGTSTGTSSLLSGLLGGTSVGTGSYGALANGGLANGGLNVAGTNGAGVAGGTVGISTATLVELLVLVARQSGIPGLGTSTGAAAGAGASTGSGALTPAARLAPGQYPKLSPPAELVGYGNGRIPADRLTSIGVGSHKLYAPAAQAYKAMTADAAAAGITIGITDSYRSYESQVELAGRKGLYSQGGLAATPGTSNHGWGLAVDLDLNPAAQQWMRDNGWRYGFVEDTPREPWHWAYRPQGT